MFLINSFFYLKFFFILAKNGVVLEYKTEKMKVTV